MVDQPSDTVTFVFTDLERSTPLWEQPPDEMRSALARHDELLATTESTVARSGAQTALLWDQRPD